MIHAYQTINNMPIKYQISNNNQTQLSEFSLFGKSFQTDTNDILKERKKEKAMQQSLQKAMQRERHVQVEQKEKQKENIENTCKPNPYPPLASCSK